MEDNLEAYSSFRIAVPAAYEKVFTHFYYAKNDTGETISKMLIPSYQTILIFSFGEKPYFSSKNSSRLEVDKYLMVGPIKHLLDYSLPPDAEMLLVNFKDDAFFRFFGSASLAEHVPITSDELEDDDPFRILWQELNSITDIHARVDRILKFSEPFFDSQSKISEQIINFKDPALNPIKSIADLNNQTERNTQLNHKKHFGYSAKEFSRYQRFLKVIEKLHAVALANSKVDWMQIASECGYYDQSQLIHDFKHYISLSPTKYLKFQQDICNPKS